MRKLMVCFHLILSLIVYGCASYGSGANPVELLHPPPLSDSNADGFWTTIDVRDTDLNEKALQDHIALCQRTGADAQVVVYKGKIVSEWYSPAYKEPVGAMSSTKVIASILVGRLVDDGLLRYDSSVSSILPEWHGGLRDKVEVIDLLTHTAGFERRFSKTDSIGYVTNKREFVLSLYPDFKPKTEFRYSNEGVQLLEPVIRAAAGMDVQRYAKERLFSPLGMNDTRLYAYGDSPWLYAEMLTTPRDMARIGLLMKNEGVWNDERIVSEEYVKRATVSSPLNKDMGYLWWILDETETVSGFYASGYLNTDIYVFRDHDIVVVRTQSPRNGYTGANESGSCFKEARKLFKKFVKK